MNENYGPESRYEVMSSDDRHTVMETKDWLITILVIQLVPIVNIVMLFVWGFGEGNINRRNFCRAYLIVMGISIAIVIVFTVILVLIGLTFMNSSYLY